MRRREFITLLGGAASLPLAARAQQVSARRPLVAVLSTVTRERTLPLNAFVQGMREFGYVEGENIDIEYRFAEGRLDRFPALADELVQMRDQIDDSSDQLIRPRTAEPIKASGSCETVFKGRTNDCKLSVLVT
jgi:hypothetical protein